MEKDTWKRLKRETLFRSPFLALFNDTVKLPNGSIINDYAVVSLRSAVMVVATDDSGNVLLINEYKYAANQLMLTLPSGGIDKDETPIEAARRELREETGYVAENFELIGTLFEYPSKAEHRIYIVRAFNAQKTKAVQHESTEYITSLELKSPQEVYEAIKKQHIKIATVISGLTLALADRLKIIDE